MKKWNKTEIRWVQFSQTTLKLSDPQLAEAQSCSNFNLHIRAWATRQPLSNQAVIKLICRDCNDFAWSVKDEDLQRVKEVLERLFPPPEATCATVMKEEREVEFTLTIPRSEQFCEFALRRVALIHRQLGSWEIKKLANFDITQETLMLTKDGSWILFAKYLSDRFLEEPSAFLGEQFVFASQ